MSERFDIIIVGGGFYGCSIALHLRSRFSRILIIEQEPDLLRHASLHNQARVHNGYHYPRNLVTAYRSAVNFPRFIQDYGDAVTQDFTNIYAIPHQFSLVSPEQFSRIYQELKVPIEPAPVELRRLFNSDLIAASFMVKEAVFNADILKDMLKSQLQQAGISVLYGQPVTKVSQVPGGLRVTTADQQSSTADYVFNCTYAGINTLLHQSQLPRLDFKHEITELAVIKVPKALEHMAITVMDGLFFSVMPFPTRQAHSLSHVRYTPHQSWSDQEKIINPTSLARQAKAHSHFPFMIRDAQRYLPVLEKAKYIDSFFEIKTVLAQNEVDDGRPILFKKDYGFKNFFIIMGGKIDNIYDILDKLKEVFD